jgi:hypothetical protein
MTKRGLKGPLFLPQYWMFNHKKCVFEAARMEPAQRDKKVYKFALLDTEFQKLYEIFGR